jgi:hypothetical protein
MNYRMALAAKQSLDRIEGIAAELNRQNAVSEKLIAEEQQAIQARLEALAILNEYANTIKSDGRR